MQRTLQQVQSVIRSLRGSLRNGRISPGEMKRLSVLAAEVRALQQVLGARFNARTAEVNALGGKAAARHRAMLESYSSTLAGIVELLENPPSDPALLLDTLDRLDALFDRKIHKKRPRILGSLPYRQLTWQPEVLNVDSPVTPAYRGGSQAVQPADSVAGAESARSREIDALVQSLGSNPAAIYEWVKNNVDTEWYWGCMKGAADTLRQRSGNDCDQAALLMSMLRASGRPARFVRGVVEFTGGLEDARALTGIHDPWMIAESFGRAGIPHEPIIAGGAISNFRFEHIWVEALVPYSNYRGAIMDEQGKSWVAMDTSIKDQRYTPTGSVDAFSAFDFSSLRDAYLSVAQPRPPLRFLQRDLLTSLSESGSAVNYDELLHALTLKADPVDFIPTGMQFREVAVMAEYASIPNALTHRMVFHAEDTLGRRIMAVNVPAYELSNRSVALRYEPETLEDQEIINAFGGLDTTPAYLVRLVPVLTVDGRRLISPMSARTGLPMGADHSITVEVVSPAGTESFTNLNASGNFLVYGVVAGRAADPGQMMQTYQSAERVYYEQAMRYLQRLQSAEDELAGLIGVAVGRPAPSVLAFGTVADVAYLLDVPHTYERKGLFIDVALRALDVVPAPDANAHRVAEFMRLASLEGSALEHLVFEDYLGLDAISTARLLGLAADQGAGPLVVNSTNAAGLLPTLPFDPDVVDDIRNAVNRGLVVKVPSAEVAYMGWSGTGWLKERAATGEAGYMLTGQIAGGMTVSPPASWPEPYASLLANPADEAAPADLAVPSGADPRCYGLYKIPVGPSGLPDAIPVPMDPSAVWIGFPSGQGVINSTHTVIAGAVGDAHTMGGAFIEVSGSALVNGVYGAYLNGHHFAAIAPLAGGTTVVNAVAVDRADARASATVILPSTGTRGLALLAYSSENSGTLGTMPDGSEAFEVVFAPLAANAASVESYALDFNGDGTPEFECPALADELTAVYTAPGLYLPTLTVTLTDGRAFTDTTVVNVMGRAGMQNIYRTIWNSMRDALLAGDVDGAMSYFTPHFRERYRAVFSGMAPMERQALFASNSDLFLNIHTELFVECEIFRQEGGQWYSYPVSFTTGAHGIWGIYGF